MKKLFLLLAGVALLAVSCRKDTKIDVVAPTVTGVRINGSDSTVVEVSAGDMLDVNVVVADNERLNEMRVVIHDADDSHTHGGTGHPGGEFHLNSGAWEKQDVLQVDNTSASFDLQVQVPDTIAGQWHLVIQVLDQVGNVSNDYAVLINVLNDEMPQITGTTNPGADATGTVYLQPNTTMYLSGLVTDPDGLETVSTYLMTYGGAQGEVTDIVMSGTPDAIEFLDVSFNNAQTGTYRLVIEAVDVLGNRRFWDNRIIVQ